MDELLKYFPLMPPVKDNKKLILALLFYLFVPSIAASCVGTILGLTIILLPLAVPVGLAANAYAIIGILFSLLAYFDCKLGK